MNRKSNKGSGPVPVNRPVYKPKSRGGQSSISPWVYIVAIVALILCGILGLLVSRNFVPTPINIDVPTASPVPSSLPTMAPTRVTAPPDIPALQSLVLDLINQDRRANGLPILKWDQSAAATGITQAQEMAQYGYLSHWNLEGQGPDIRHYIKGGIESVREYSYRKQFLGEMIPANTANWASIARQVYVEFKNDPSFQSAILNQVFTQAGVGVSYDPSTGWFVIVQEFLGRYISVETLPRVVALGTEIDLKGKVDITDAQAVLVEIAYEPLPASRSLTELDNNGDFISVAQVYQTYELPLDNGQFLQKIVLDNVGKPGYYHIYIWVNVPPSGRFLAVDYIIQVVQ